MEEKICKYCNKKFPSGKSLGGHIRIHKKKYSGMGENPKKKKERFCCRECGKEFVSWKALCGHMACHSVKVKIEIDRESDTETSSVAAAPIRRRSKRKKILMKNLSNSEFFSYGGSSSGSEIDQEQKDGAFCLMMMSRDCRNLVDSSDNNSVILETKSSSREELKIFNVDDKVAGDSSDSDHLMNGLKKSDSDICVDGSLKNSGIGSGFNNSLNRFRNTNEIGFSKNSLSGHKRVCSSSKQEHRIEHEAAQKRYLIDLNLPAHPDFDE